MACHDRPKHSPPNNANLLNHTTALPPPLGALTVAPRAAGACSAARYQCLGAHNGRFEVCAGCMSHSRDMLFLRLGSPQLTAPSVSARPSKYRYFRNNHERNPFTIAVGGGLAGPAGPFNPASAIWPPVGYGPIAGSTPSSRWPGFLTRVCLECERDIQSEVHWRNQELLFGAGAGIPAAVPTWAKSGDWTAYPFVACKCRRSLEHFSQNNARCFMHLRKKFVDEIEGKRDRNCKWLQQIAAQETGGRVQTYWLQGRARKQQRHQNGRAMACRCGRELPDNPLIPAGGAPPVLRALICMACEGYVSLVAPLAAHYVGGLRPLAYFGLPQWKARQKKLDMMRNIT